MDELNRNSESRNQEPEDERFYFPCPLRKGQPRIAVTVCHGKKCIWLTSEGGKLKCGYADPNPTKPPKVKKGENDY